MAKEYGVYKEGTDLWEVTLVPLTTGTAAQAEHYTQADATSTATYLTTTTGETYLVGRPDDRHPH